MSHRNWVVFMQNFLAKAIVSTFSRKEDFILKRPESLKSTAFLLTYARVSDFWVNQGPDDLACLGDPPNLGKVIWPFFENLSHLTLIGMSYESKTNSHL